MRQKALGISAIAILIIVGLSGSPPAFSETVLGQSCALTGPTAFLGTQMHRGAAAYFDRNAQNIRLLVKDDGYEPDRCIQNTEAFVAEPVHALFGYVGTPTSKVAVPLAKAANTIFFGAFTGADFLSDPRANPHSFSLRASYDAEIENMIRRLKEDVGVKKISLFVQRDAFGFAGVSGARKAVSQIEGIEIIPALPSIPPDGATDAEWEKFWRFVPNYKRNSLQVGQSVRQIAGNRVDAVIMVGAYLPCAAAINMWRRLDFDAVFMNISFVGSHALARSLRGNTANVFISQVVPDPWDAGVPVVREYQEAIGGSDFGFVSLEGFLAAKAMDMALGAAGDAPDFSRLKRAIESMSNADLGGYFVSFGPADHRGSDTVYLTEIEAVPGPDGKFDYTFSYIDRISKR